MQLGLRDKVAVVTGASRGIGRAVAQTLLEEGSAVAICSRNAAQLDAAVHELSKKGRVLGVPTDVTDESAVKKFVATVHKEFGRVDILVNNAGTHLRGTVESTTLDVLERQLRDKVFGFFAMIKAVLPIMKAQRATHRQYRGAGGASSAPRSLPVWRHQCRIDCTQQVGRRFCCAR